MAGISGIIIRNSSKKIDIKLAANLMLTKLSLFNKQLKGRYINNQIFLGNAVPISVKKNERFQYNEKLNIICVIDGIVFLDKEIKQIIHKTFNLAKLLNDYECLPFLYKLYFPNLENYLTGNFNIFFYDLNSNKCVLINDRFGFLPLYYYMDDKLFIFSSKLESIIATGLIGKISFDITTFAERLFFNYTLSDYTYIKNIKTLTNAQKISFCHENIIFENYWNIEKLYDYPVLNSNDSFDLLNSSLERSCKKIFSQMYKSVNLTLTGGWDSRVVLSYLYPEYKEKFNIYSFGAEFSDDIIIPKQISKKESLTYYPFILDKAYLKIHFINYARRTIELSNGTRNYKRAHYLYAIEKIAKFSDIVITGIFGDEIFKVGKPKGGDVLSSNTINMIENDFDVDKTINFFRASPFSHNFDPYIDLVNEELANRLNKIKSRMQIFDKKAQKYFSIRFEYNLRKYFGYEVNSYNDFIYSYSPFIDENFLINYSKTKFAGFRFPFVTGNLYLKKQSSQLYTKLVEKNYKPLIYFSSSRGYSMYDTMTISGKFKIFEQKFIKKNKNVDSFNTKNTNEIFNYFLNNINHNEFIFSNFNYNIEDSYIADMNSLNYWINYIRNEYI